MGTRVCIALILKAATVLTASALGMAVLSSCGDSDSSTFQDGTIVALESRVASMETVLAEPTTWPTAAPPTATMEPDMVVGVEWHCRAGSRTSGLEDESGVTCQLPFSSEWCARDEQPDWDRCVWVQEVVAVVTVRVVDGRTYTVTVQEPHRFIELGQSWPPN